MSPRSAEYGARRNLQLRRTENVVLNYLLYQKRSRRLRLVRVVIWLNGGGAIALSIPWNKKSNAHKKTVVRHINSKLK